IVAVLPAGVEVLVRRGIVYARICDDDAIELLLPTALLVQLKSWEGEDPRSLRALLSEAPFETATAIATHYLGRPATPPIALSLEQAWEVLGDPDSLRAEVARISSQEQRLLDQLEQVGGEVDTQELMDLEREPMRVRGVYGVAAGRRGAAFSLEKRGFLFPAHPNRYVVPSEVAAIIGAERRSQRDKRREDIRSHVVEEDHLPRRARFSSDPAPLALALAVAVRESAGEVRPSVGTPRSLVSRLAQRFGREFEPTALIVALSRAIGLWEAGINAAAPPGALSMTEVGALLFETWRRGGAWDEARPDAEVLRVSAENRDPSPVGVLREVVLDALHDLGEGQWVPYGALMSYIQNDPRAPGLERLLERWARRVMVEIPSLRDLTRRVLLESLPALGVVDVGGASVMDRSLEELGGLALRLTTRGRELISEEASSRNVGESELIEPRVLRVGGDATVADVLDVALFAEVKAAANALELAITPTAMARGLAEGIEARAMRERLEGLTVLSDELASALDEAATIVGRATLTSASAFLWVDDPDVREMLRMTAAVADMFVEPSPPSGLLVAAGIDTDRLVRRCRALGVEVAVEDGLARVRSQSSYPPPKRESLSWRPPPARPRRRASGNGKV
ncbi:MAG TPA: hypothetical protein VFB62_11520, partial [Polyangiaceae bacterium]|nr:hypothetical protein [Polyangiaceae bacterium]